MSTGKLTDKAIKNAKTGERPTILSDGGGLQLWLMPTGGKLWNYAYRFGGKRKKLAIGPYGKERLAFRLTQQEGGETRRRASCEMASIRRRGSAS